MPAKVLPDAEAFARFCEWMERRGFRRISRGEFSKDFHRLGLVAPSPREGREVGFQFHANGLDAVVWTTFLCPEGHARDRDAGWVLIRDGDKAKYFARPLSRTRNFLRNLLGWGRIAQLRVQNRPNCPKCHARMHIATGKGFKARYWRCEKPAHATPVCITFDHGLPPAALEFVKKFRKARARHRDKLRKEGKKPGAAVRRRRSWKVTRPQNLVLPSR